MSPGRSSRLLTATARRRTLADWRKLIFEFLRKVVGARFYHKGFEATQGPLKSFNQTFFLSACDQDGHGSHTASTIAGNEVPDANLFILGRGTARGGVLGARLAIYKACWFNFCDDADLLAAFDDAIGDGVDVLSLSLGPLPPQPSYFSDVNSIGSISAFQRGIIASFSAGNSFFPGTATNIAPWILTVAASPMDREFNTNIYLRNSMILKGNSLNPFEMDDSHGLILGGVAAAPGIPAFSVSFCYNNTLSPATVKGKIVVCKVNAMLEDQKDKAVTVKDAGGVRMILFDTILIDAGLQFVIPVNIIDPLVAIELRAYMKATKYPVARIAPSVTVLNTERAQAMAVFSSKGPNVLSPDIIKPEITAPGVNILAAWLPVSTTATVAGSSTTTHPNGTQATPFDYGSGHINLVAALDPGLLYNFDVDDVTGFLCGTGATPEQLRNVIGSPLSCPTHAAQPTDLNYPSIGVSNLAGILTVRRTVTYCGQGPTVYNVHVSGPPGVSVSVYPSQIRFNKAGEKMGFRIVLHARQKSDGFMFGSLVWRNSVHSVRSPIAVWVVST